MHDIIDVVVVISVVVVRTHHRNVIIVNSKTILTSLTVSERERSAGARKRKENTQFGAPGVSGARNVAL